MTAPVRIQRRRTKGWRMPEGAVYVGRPTKWENTHRVSSHQSREYVVELYRREVTRGVTRWQPSYVEAFIAPLRGRDLVCWCPLDQPCHADVLLELANRKEPR